MHDTWSIGGLCSVAFVLASGCVLAQTRESANASPQTHVIIIKDYRYQPEKLNIAVGDTVQWRNEEKRTSHSVLFLGREIPESERMFPDEHWQMTFTEIGAFPYRCGPHPEMRGVIHVGSELRLSTTNDLAPWRVNTDSSPLQ